MAYTPINWQTGDTITAEKMNKMDNGWSVTTERTTLFDSSVTTAESDGNYRGTITLESSIAADTAIITFNGTEYECPSLSVGQPDGYYVYGGFKDFAEYPFYIVYGDDIGVLYTQTAGTYTLKIEGSTSSVETSESFREAVEAVMPTMPKVLECVEGVTILNEAQGMINNGGIVYFTAAEESYTGASKKLFFINTADRTCTIFPTSTKIVAGFGTDDSLFYINHTS